MRSVIQGGADQNHGRGPRLPDAALCGPVGDWVRDTTPHTEADPAALLISALVACGVVAGRGPHFWAGDARQAPVLFAVVAADTPKANRGLSWAVTRRLVEVIDPHLVRQRIRTGVGNGRLIVDALARSARPPARSNEPRMGGANRLLVHEPGLTRLLEVAGRPSSELALVIRSAWDGTPIDVGRTHVTNHHVGIVAHATLDQLAQRLSLTGGGVSFVNRFLFVVARRQPSVVDESSVPTRLVLDHGKRLRNQLAVAATFGRVERSRAAEERWRSRYDELVNDDPGGLLGIMVARAPRHVLRLALVYALVEASPRVERRHMDAALALWNYCRASAAQVCDRVAVPSRDLSAELLAGIAAAGERGLSLTEQLDLFGRNVPATRLRSARESLEETGRVVSTKERRVDSVRAITVSRAAARAPSARPGSSNS
jgi:hypothetical protein